MSAFTTLFFVLIPIIRVLFGVFPFSPNRWFGIGFLAYYCCFMPLLYRVRCLGEFAACHACMLMPALCRYSDGSMSNVTHGAGIHPC